MITERTLRKWRKEALNYKSDCEHRPTASAGDDGLVYVGKEIFERILRLTQELLDQHLLRKPTR